MTENCCYDLFALETLEIARQGHFGHITHCEGAYIHHIKSPQPTGCYHSDTQRNWMVHSCAAHGGNPYPTHAIGPIAQLLDFHHADRMVSLVSVTAKGAFEGDETDVMGRINTALIQTRNGVSIMLQLDVTTPRPYNRLQTVCGTKAFVGQFSLALRNDLRGSNIKVTNIAPGLCKTEFSEVRFKGDKAKADSVYENTKFLSADDIAKVICAVLSLPEHININELELMPVTQTWAGFHIEQI